MSEWLDLMMDEVDRKKQELEEAKAESERRREDGSKGQPDQAGPDEGDDQS